MEQPVSSSAMRAKILIVDDDESLAEYFSDLLLSQGFETAVFNNSKAALNYCKTNLDDFSLVISDVCMPEMKGDELAKEILSLNSDMPIILCSGYTEHTSKQQLLDLGIKSFMDKPVDSAALLDVINNLKLC